MESPPGQPPRIEIEDPLKIIEQASRMHRQKEISNTPIFRRVLDRLVHPVAGVPVVDITPTAQEKAISWKASRGYSGVDVTRAPGPDRFRHELLPSGEKEWRKAVRISRHEVHRAAENVDLRQLEKGVYEINPETGKSSWRSADGSLRHVNGKTRRQIKKDEKAYGKLRSRIEKRHIALVGSDAKQPHRAKRIGRKSTTETKTREIVHHKTEDAPAKVVKTQEKNTIRSRIEATKPIIERYEKERAKRARKEQVEIQEQEGAISFKKQVRNALRQRKKAVKKQQSEGSGSTRNIPRRNSRNYPARPSARGRQNTKTIVRTAHNQAPRQARTERGRRYQEQQAINRRGVV